MAHLADELLQMIFTNLCSHCSGPSFPSYPVSNTLRSVALASKRFYRVAEPLLYHAFSSEAPEPESGSSPVPIRQVSKTRPILNFLQTIVHRPDLAAEVCLLDLTASVSLEDFCGGDYDSLVDLSDDDAEHDPGERLYNLLLRLVYFQCLHLDTLNFRVDFRVWPLDLENEAVLRVRGAISQLPEVVFCQPPPRRLFRNFNFHSTGPLDVEFLGHVDTVQSMFRELRTLTLVREDWGEGDMDPWIHPPRGTFSTLQELNLLDVGPQDGKEIIHLISACTTLRTFRFRITQGSCASYELYWAHFGDITHALKASCRTLEYLEYSAPYDSPDYLDLNENLWEFSALKTLKISAGHFWVLTEDLAVALDRSRPDPSWLGTGLVRSSEEIWTSIKWLPRNLTRLDIAFVTPCQLEFLPCIAAGKALCYPDLVDLRVAFDPLEGGDSWCGTGFCERGTWEESELENRCSLENPTEGQFEILEADRIFADAGITVRQLPNLYFWDDIHRY